ncbi:MAG: PAC2 family protein, partial [Actinobacteria bacterium]|nr:PAC2 family protein [Actinomycetota bacterium]
MDHIVWDSRPAELRRPVMVAAFGGWNDAASAASGAISFVGGELSAERFARMDPEEFYDFQDTRPLIDLTTSGRHSLTWPEVEFYGARTQHGPDVVLVSGTEPSMRWRTFCETILGVASALDVERIVTLGSLLADVAHTRPIRLTAIASDQRLIDGMGTRPPSYRGPTGIVAVLHQIASDAGMSSASLWAPVPHYAAGVPNPKGALALVRGLSTVAGLRFDLTELEASARVHEVQVSRAVERDERLKDLVERIEA